MVVVNGMQLANIPERAVGSDFSRGLGHKSTAD